MKNINYVELDEDNLRKLNPKWQEPQRQPINGGQYNSKGKYCLEREKKYSSIFKYRYRKIDGLLAKSANKTKFDDVYSKLCKSGFANEPMYYNTVRDTFLSYFRKESYKRAVYYVDDDGIIREIPSKPSLNKKNIYIYEDEGIYNVNHDNLKSIEEEFIKAFGKDVYCYLQAVDSIKESKYNEYVKEWNIDKCNQVMESSNRSRNYRPKFYILGEHIIFRFIFPNRHRPIKKIIYYNSKEYYIYKKQNKKKKKSRKLTKEQIKEYTTILKLRKKLKLRKNNDY